MTLPKCLGKHSSDSIFYPCQAANSWNCITLQAWRWCWTRKVLYWQTKTGLCWIPAVWPSLSCSTTTTNGTKRRLQECRTSRLCLTARPAEGCLTVRCDLVPFELVTDMLIACILGSDTGSSGFSSDSSDHPSEEIKEADETNPTTGSDSADQFLLGHFIHRIFFESIRQLLRFSQSCFSFQSSMEVIISRTTTASWKRKITRMACRFQVALVSNWVVMVHQRIWL